jgi:Bacterial membrane protein YfhO
MRPPGVPPLGSNPEIGDQARVFQPFLQYTRKSLPSIPLWDPSIMAGRPFLANGQSAVFSPFSVPAYVLPFWRSLAVMAALKLFVAAFGTYLLGRALGMGLGGALLAGVVFGFSLWLVAWLPWPNASVWAFLPWLWLLADRIVRRPGLLSICALAGVIGLQYVAGQPESSFHVLAFTAIFFLARLLQRGPAVGPRLRPLARPLAAFAAAAVLGSALAALVLIPFVELLAHSSDTSSRANFGELHTPARYLLGVFLHDYWGRPTRTSIAPNGSVMHGRAFYVGALPLILAAVALVLGRSGERIAVALIGASSLVVVVGLQPLVTITKVLPGFRVSENTRLVVVFALCVALLAGWGLHDLAGRRRRAPRRSRVALVLAAGIVGTPILWMVTAGEGPPLSLLDDGLRIAWGFAAPPRLPVLGRTTAEVARVSDEIRLASLLEWLVLAGLGLALVALRFARRLGPTAFTALALVLTVADLFKAGVGLNPAIPIDTASQPLTPALRLLQNRRPNRFVGLNPTYPFSVVNPLPADLALRYSLFDPRGYDFPIEDRFGRFWRRDIAQPGCPYHFCTTGARASPQALRALGLLSVADLLQQRADPVLRAARTKLRYNGPDGRIYSNRWAVPRVFVVDRQRVAPDADSALRAVGSPEFRPRRVVVTEKPLAGVSQAAPRPGSTSGGSARLASYGAERVVVEARVRRPGVLVLTDTHFPGWKARVDGKSTSVVRVDYLLRGVRLAPGRHRVEFVYEPASWRAGRIVSALALAALVAMAVAGWRRRGRLERRRHAAKVG